MDERLAAVAAKVEIAEMQARYEWAIDEGRVEELRPLFDEAAVLTLEPGGTNLTGAAAIMEWFNEYCHGWGWENRRHYITNVQTVVSGDVARCRAYFLLTFEARGKARIGWGNYDDTLVRRGEGWVFTEKHIRSTAPVALERGWAGATLEPTSGFWHGGAV